MIRHFNVTTYIYNPKDRKFLFVLHKKLNKWVAPGGHIEENENPEVAALREVKEETGLDVELLGNRVPSDSDLIRPYGIQLNVINKDGHEHFDLIYIAVPGVSSDIKIFFKKEESRKIGWFSLEEIIESGFNSFTKNKEWCKYFSEMLNNC